MRHELRRLDPMRTANIAALIYGLLMTVFSLLFFPIFFLAGLLGSAEEGAGPLGALFGVFMLVLYPIMGVVTGWITGAVTAVAYNFIIRWTGGLLLEIEEWTPGPSPG